MIIPKYWVKIEYPATDSTGKDITIVSRGWSLSSKEDAISLAKSRARKMLKRINHKNDSESYLVPYDKIPLAEPIIENINDKVGNLIGVITRNHEGCLVLNTKNLVFIDVDLPKIRISLICKILSIFFKETKKDSEQETYENIIKVLEHYRLSARIYKTKAGFRIILENSYSPDDFNLLKIMKELKADPLYIKLCKRQNCFRARLTPKPYRIGLSNLAHKFPYQESEIYEWETQYKNVISNYSVCVLLKTLNNSPELNDLTKLHDQYCNIAANLPLA